MTVVSVSLVRGDPIALGSRQELFVDRYLVEELKGEVGLRLNRPEKREVVLVMDHPPEDATSAYFTVFRDGPKVRMYYRGNTTDDGSEDQTTCYAESADGVHFERPKLGLYEVKGSKENNVCYRGAESAAFAPFKDENPDCKSEERYKAVGYRVIDGKTGSASTLVSADGIHWKRASERPVMTGSFDSLNTARWDPVTKKYRMYSRYWTAGAFAGVRGIQSSESEDFVHWSTQVPNEYPGVGVVEHFYTNAVTAAPGSPHIYLSFPMRFVPERKKVASHPEVGVSDAVFMASRDGVHWDRSMRGAWVSPGLDQKNWTERSNMPAWGIVETSGGDEWSMYVSEHYRWPDNRLRRVTVPRGRLASVHAGSGGGEVVTKAVTFDGGRMVINYATSAVGDVRVEITDGNTIASSEIMYGDELDGVVKWKGDIGGLAGKEVTVKFVMKDADVYGFRFEGGKP